MMMILLTALRSPRPDVAADCCLLNQIHWTKKNKKENLLSFRRKAKYSCLFSYVFILS